MESQCENSLRGADRRKPLTLARVLVVDDDAQFRRAIRVALTARGYEVSEAADGLQALVKMQATPMGVVLPDWGMPEMDGEATCRALRAASSVPIIVVTASDRIREALAAGADSFLRKPVDIGSLLARIEAALERNGGAPRVH